MATDIPVHVLDGRDTIGGTKILVERGRRGLLLDFGQNFERFGKFFEEYLMPRKPVGLRDMWLLGIIPRYKDLYRPCLRLGDLPGAMDLPVDTVDGVVLSHAHMDHSGNIGLLNLEIPVIASPATLAILRALQDSGRVKFYQEAAYSSPIEVKSTRSQEHIRTSTGPHKGRPAFVMRGEVQENLRLLWRRAANPDESGRKMDTAEIEALESVSFDWDIKSFPVDHSIPGASGIVLETDQGCIVYSGDVRDHGAQGHLTREFIGECSSMHPWVLIMEGTRVAADGENMSTEEQCKQNCLDAVHSANDSLVVADFSSRHVERLETFRCVAQKTGRSLVILPKDAYLLYCLEAAGETVPIVEEDYLIYDPIKGKENKWETWIFEKYEDARITAGQIGGSPGDFIASFSFYDIKYLNDIRPEGGLYMYSSSEPHTEEERIDFKRLYAWLAHHRFEVRGFQMVDGDFKIERGYHCSGHAPESVIQEMVEKIEPEVLIPVHTNDPQWFKRTFGGQMDVVVDANDD